MTDLTLALSTSSPALSLALFDGPTLVSHDHRLIGRGHAEALMPAIAAMLGNRRPARIIVDIGPGSFTGIRIGIAAARALGLAWGVPVTGCTSSLLVAAKAFALNSGLPRVIVLLDAGRGQVLRQCIEANYDRDGPETILVQPILVNAGEATAGIAAPDGAIHHGHPDAACAMTLPPAARGFPPQAVYVRPPDAILPL